MHTTKEEISNYNYWEDYIKEERNISSASYSSNLIKRKKSFRRTEVVQTKKMDSHWLPSLKPNILRNISLLSRIQSIGEKLDIVYIVERTIIKVQCVHK